MLKNEFVRRQQEKAGQPAETRLGHLKEMVVKNRKNHTKM
jgi:hypothetical protein